MEHQGTKYLQTERLILRPFQIDDAKSVYENWASDSEVTKYLTWLPHVSVDVSRKYIEFCIDGYNEKTTYQWGIELKETHELIGNISVVHIEEDIESMELGWVIGRTWWRNGYMSEAASCVIEFLFNDVQAKRICAKHDIHNPHSGAVMQKVGMQYEGTLRKSCRNNQGIVDCAHYSILQGDYQ